jgi:hypothetical protein
MKITKSQLRQVIQEELQNVLNETIGATQPVAPPMNYNSDVPAPLRRKVPRAVEPIPMPHPGDPAPGEEPQFVGVGDTGPAAAADRLRQQGSVDTATPPPKSHRSLGRRGFSNFQDLYKRADALGLNTDKLLGKDKGYGRDEKMGRLTRGLMRRVLQGEKATASGAAMKTSMDKALSGVLNQPVERTASHPANQLYQQTMRRAQPQTRRTTATNPDR